MIGYVQIKSIVACTQGQIVAVPSFHNPLHQRWTEHHKHFIGTVPMRHLTGWFVPRPAMISVSTRHCLQGLRENMMITVRERTSKVTTSSYDRKRKRKEKKGGGST
jgi:hypothetical protein